jgi:GTP-binding protein
MSTFCDQAIVEFIGGKGGDGSLHFRREKYIDHGGPDGGDGGEGGSIILIADENINTLFEFNNQKTFRAEDGGNGQKKLMYGKNGISMTLRVPAGTLLIDYKTKNLICDLKKHNQQFVIAKGGRGGFGNTHFKSSTHQAPEFAENGENGQKQEVLMELQLVADAGIIGFPSAGKSTLISRISNARPKIADYPFTTLIPNLGVVAMASFDKRMKATFVVADIPGLIEGAHHGKGLGHKFLRHVSRCEILIHLIDPTRDCPEDYIIINEELEKYDKRLAGKQQITCISKSDTVPAETLKKFKKQLEKLDPKLKGEIFVISSVTGEGLKELMFEVWKHIESFRKTRIENLEQFEENEAILKETEEKIFRPHMEEQKFKVTFRRSKLEASTGKERKIFDVSGGRIEQVVQMTDTENEEGLERIYHFLTKLGVRDELRHLGAKPGDRIRIGGRTFLMR